MAISVFDLYSIGIGPSSSHTVGPMRAARRFAQFIESQQILPQTSRIVTDLYGSLALTGKGHSTDTAILLGLSGYTPEGVDPDEVHNIISSIRKHHKLNILEKHSIPFNEPEDLLFHGDRQLPYHPNGMRFTAFDASGKQLIEKVYYSVGGGFIVEHQDAAADTTLGDHHHPLPHPFKSAEELLQHCLENNCTIQDIMMANERTWRTDEEIRAGILKIWHVMEKCVDRGCHQTGILPGGLNVRRRAAQMYQTLTERKNRGEILPTDLMEWVSMWALAVNEENAAAGRVVTAPTNGSAGVIPAVIHYYKHIHPESTEEGIITFFLVSGAIGILYKEGASISAAEMGCMGEVGVACSMAAAGLTAALGGTVTQVENAAEIGMEHNLGLTCDPILGLVQIPCIERNTMGAVKAINAALLALAGDGLHRVSLDQVIATMRQTGHDMMSIYKETSQGGLAVNVPEC